MHAALAAVKLKRARPWRKKESFTVVTHVPMTDVLPIPVITVVVAVVTNPNPLYLFNQNTLM